ncbi:SAM-dependent methyltransferase [Dactylosporangium aurantiacum]|uniref:SAM-dependent methyltransferase n=1 Tax=Dactylosporangium aurantiacum TaxID=35754 RepID=UPI0005252B2A|nr:SAM-dependent methyltransferase [Dactylosporangium aurantiacum]MDG6104097.1 SAM-dependent methyltransferase [Dactylosporangium aurantiacum]
MDSTERSRIDTTVPHPARRYSYWLGGKDHFAADRESGDAIAARFPAVVALARANRAFLGRSVRFLAESGVRQFLDLGTGLPAPDNTHEVAQRVAPEARVVYVDNDPIVMVHARALLQGDPRGKTAYLEADVRDPDAILTHPSLLETLDLTQPVGVLLVTTLHFVHDDEQVAAIVRRLLDAVPSGSYLVITHGTMDFSTAEGVAAYEKMFAAGGTDVRARPKSTVEQYFAGLEIVAPGIVPVGDWRPDATTDSPVSADLQIYGVVGRKP